MQNALGLPIGAEYHRCALQVNPHHYAATYRGRTTTGTPAQHARAIVEKAIDLGISVLAVTDHNHVGGVPEFRAAAEGTGVHIFPGFELASSEGVHVLCIYPTDIEQGQLERYLGEFGIRDTNPSSALADTPFSELLAKVREQGGIAVSAHVTNDGGLFRTLEGQPRIQAWKCKDLLAIQIPGPVDDLTHGDRLIVQNKNADYARPHAASHEAAIAVVNAKDVTQPDDLEDRAASCWIKMSEVSIEGLRQAYFDPGSRIRLNPKEGEFRQEEHAELLAMTWTGGFLDGTGVRFNPNLNVLVGGRGAGKSTVIESIRAVLGLYPIGDDARSAHRGIVQHVLRSGTKIVLSVRVCRPASRVYRIERTLPNPPIVRDESGEVSKLSPAEILEGVEVFGQHEISELTKSREKLTRLLDRFVVRDDLAIQRRKELRRELAKNRRNLLDARSELQRIDELLAALPGLEETLVRFREAGLEEKLKEKSLLVREEHLFASLSERLTTFRESEQLMTRELPIDREFVSPSALEDLPGRKILGRLDQVLIDLEGDLRAVAGDMKAALKRADDATEAVRVDWASRKQAVEDTYEKILRELQKSKVDGEEFIRLRHQIEKLKPLREKRAAVQSTEEEQTEQRRNLLADWEDLEAEEYRRLDRAARKINRRLRDRVQVEVTALGNREPLFELLRDDVGGRLSEGIELLRAEQDLSLRQFADACRQGADAVREAYQIPPGQTRSLASASPEVLMRIEELSLPATTSIRLNIAPTDEPPVWRDLDDLSTGQKATAVLLLLLLESEAPLIVDQPEDDLDNRFITEGVVPRMRDEKQRRQFLFSTHNANIPVLGDAELIIGLSVSGEAEHGQAHVAPEHMGSIDLPSVRELVEEILEGGKEAFERRRQKYGI